MKIKDFIRSLDSETYLFKLKIIDRLNSQFGTNINIYDAEYIYFWDIIKSVSPKIDSTDIFKALQDVIGEGVDKTKMNTVFAYINQTMGAQRIDETLYKSIDDTFHQTQNCGRNMNVFAGMFDTIDKSFVGCVMVTHYPLWMVDYCFLIPSQYPLIEALMVDNGYVIIIRTGHSENDFNEDEKRLFDSLIQQQNGDDDYNDDDDDE